MNGNTNKNTGGASGKGFDVSGQPSSESKSAGWDRRRQAIEMMNKLREYMTMDKATFEAITEDIEAHPENHTVQDVLLHRYATKAFNGDKMMVDWINRIISYAPVQNEVSDPDGKPLSFGLDKLFLKPSDKSIRETKGDATDSSEPEV